jgi:hypothetical protein
MANTTFAPSPSLMTPSTRPTKTKRLFSDVSDDNDDIMNNEHGREDVRDAPEQKRRLTDAIAEQLRKLNLGANPNPKSPTVESKQKESNKSSNEAPPNRCALF